MTSLSDHSSDEFVKALVLGPSGAGKTGALASLVKAGYKLKIIDLDNGLGILKNMIKDVGGDLSLVDYEMVRDKYEASSQGPVCKKPRAYRDTNKLLDEWTDGSIPSEWGPDTILVIDSLTNLGKAAYAFAAALNPAYKSKLLWYGDAQELIDTLVAMVTDEAFRTNVLILTHIELTEQPDGTIKGYASSIGKALGPKLARNFNNMISIESKTMGRETKRKIVTLPTSLLDLKTESPKKVKAEYSLETGMAEIFASLKGK